MRFEDDAHQGAVVRLATPEDNAQLLEVFGDVPMRGELILTTERSPAFFALYDIQDVEALCTVYERDGEILAMGSFLIRPGFVRGQLCTVCYLGDLRVRSEGAGLISRFYGDVFTYIQSRWDVDHFYTGILASNAKALHALTRRSEKRQSQPQYDFFRGFDAAQIQFTRRPRTVAEMRHLKVRTATDADLPQIVAHLQQDHQQRPFGEDFGHGGFEHRLANWPGFSLEKTYLCFDEGVLCGLCTAWDAAPLKRYRVLAYRGKMKWVQMGYNLGAKVFRYPPLPAPGGVFKYLYLANLSVQSWPALLALVQRIYDDFKQDRYHFMMVYLEDDSPLRPMLRHCSSRLLPFHLYAVRAPGEVEVFDYGQGVSGFEIALA